MKKIIFGIIALFVLTSMNAMASDGGTEIKYYDVSAYINNYPIPCYNINGYCGIYVKDLSMYGFDVSYDSDNRVVNVNKNKNCTEISGVGDVLLPWQKNGTVYAETEYSGIRVLIEGNEVPSYCVNEYMMILMDDLYPYGRIFWSEGLNTLFFTMDEFPKIEYQPLWKAEKQYTRIKPESWQLDLGAYDDFPTEQCDWGFVKHAGAEPELYSWQKSVLEKFDAYYMDPSKPHAIYLTFDEGYEAGYTQQILDTLSYYNVPATFFVTGQYVNESPELVKEMIDRGFSIGNHTVNHCNLSRASVSTIVNELEVLSNNLKYNFGYDKMFYMRPPEGAFNERSLAIAKDMGYNTILWSFAYYDYDTSVQHGTDYAYNEMTTYMHDGAIMLIHAVSRDNANALGDVIRYAIDNGYELRSLDDLCNP